MSNILSAFLSKFGTPADNQAATPVAVATSTVMGDSVGVKFGFNPTRNVSLDLDKTYHQIAKEQADAAGQVLQTDREGNPTYTAQYIVEGDPNVYVVNPNLTLRDLQAKYNPNQKPATVSIPDPEQSAGRLG